jgi:hypothetical protein
LRMRRLGWGIVVIADAELLGRVVEPGRWRLQIAAKTGRAPGQSMPWARNRRSSISRMIGCLRRL